MTTSTLHDTFIGPWGVLGILANDVLGMPWVQENSASITKVGWTRVATGAAGAPTGLAIYEAGNTTALWSTSAPTDTGAVGAQWTDVGTPIPVVAGHTYYVCGYWQNGDSVPYVTGANRPATEPVLVDWPVNTRVHIDSVGGMQYPTSQDTVHWYGMNVTLDDTGGSPNPTGTVGYEIEAAFERWEGTSDNTRPNGLPYLTKQVLDAHTDTLAGISGSITAQGVTVDAIAGDVAALHAKISADGVTLDEKIGPLRAYGGVTNEGVSGGVEIVRNAVDALPATVQNASNTASALLREWITLSPELVEGARWHLVNTTTGEGRGLVEDQADLYILTITATGDLRVEVVAGVDWVPRWGYGVAPRVNGAYRQRQFHDYSPAAITAEGLFMDGLLINALPGIEWQVAAWTLDR